MSDGEFDALAASIDPSKDTGNAPLDEFFRTKFSAYTGQWIHAHPGLTRLEGIYNNLFRSLPDGS